MIPEPDDRLPATPYRHLPEAHLQKQAALQAGAPVRGCKYMRSPDIEGHVDRGFALARADVDDLYRNDALAAIFRFHHQAIDGLQVDQPADPVIGKVDHHQRARRDIADVLLVTPAAEPFGEEAYPDQIPALDQGFGLRAAGDMGKVHRHGLRVLGRHGPRGRGHDRGGGKRQRQSCVDRLHRSAPNLAAASHCRSRAYGNSHDSWRLWRGSESEMEQMVTM